MKFLPRNRRLLLERVSQQEKQEQNPLEGFALPEGVQPVKHGKPAILKNQILPLDRYGLGHYLATKSYEYQSSLASILTSNELGVAIGANGDGAEDPICSATMAEKRSKRGFAS